MTDADWFAQACAVAGPLPDSYLVVDIETTGLAQDDVPIQIGWAIVLGGRLVNNAHELINWSTIIPDDWMDFRLTRTAEQVRQRDNTDYVFNTRMLKAGRHYPDVFRDFLSLVAACDESAMTVVCHNGLRVDVAMIDRAARHYLDRRFEPVRYFDTMALERGLQTRKMLLPGESWDQYCRRVYYAGGSKVKSSLHGWCMPRYKLAVDTDRVHQADYDCLMTHQLLEAYRNLCPDHMKGPPKPEATPA